MNEAKESLLSPTQKKIVGAALAAISFCVIVAIIFFSFILLRNFLVYFSDVLLPLAIAGIGAMLLQPIVRLFEKKLKLSRIKAIVLLYALVLLFCFGIFALVFPIIFGQLQDLLSSTPEILKSIITFIETRYPQLPQLIKENLGEDGIEGLFAQFGAHAKTALTSSMLALNTAKTTLLGAFGKIAAYAVIPIYLFYLLDTDRKLSNDLTDQLTFLKDEWRNDLVFLATEFIKILVSFFRGQIIIGMILALLLALGFTLVGLKFGFILGLIIGLLNIVPYLGTILGIATILPIAYFQPNGGPALIGLCALVFIVGQLITDYVLTPRIMGKETGLGPMAIIFSIFFWGLALDGLLGMVLAIPLSAFFVIFWRLAKKKYLPKILGSKEITDESETVAPA